MAPSRAPFVCATCCKFLARPSSSRAFSTTTSHPQRSRDAAALASEDTPRWMTVPHRMRMPLRLRPQPRGPVWKVNTEQAPVDEMYDKFFVKTGGTADGRNVLSDEIKWLALTHKSFEHGAVGNSDRLAFLGKRIIDLQASLALLRSPAPPRSSPSANHVFQHPALENVENMSPFARDTALEKSRLARLARTYGISGVMRWKPRRSDDMKGSGEDTVLVHTLYSIVGAVALQRGGPIAARVARERVLHPLGLK